MTMKSRTKPTDLCEFTGCNHKATTLAHKLFGKGGTIRTCDEHRPGSRPSPIPIPRPFYRLEPIGDGK